jgi:hypothetical protein
MPSMPIRGIFGLFNHCFKLAISAVLPCQLAKLLLGFPVLRIPGDSDLVLLSNIANISSCSAPKTARLITLGY